ncbi:LysM peptidoglycan-binding domain-containing protein [Megasphaera sp.]|uniref:LysM peptidoglycan-binding domain-containing protein n=1 Tax=Megasphaera sp. TaxID=2023260 RepID=UPI003F7F746C
MRTRKKILTFSFAASLCLGIGYAGWQAMASPDVKLTYYVVEPGDTLWDIADKYREDDQDIRDAYTDIAKTNNLRADQDIYPGQRLLIKDGRATR